MNDENNNSIKGNVLSAIDSGKILMKPKWHFISHTILVILGAIFVTLSLLYLVSFIFFILHQSGLWFTPAFGMRGMRELIFGFPWLLILLSIILIVILQFLVKNYSFGYGKPLIYSVILVVLTVISGGFVISQTSVHKNLFIQARNSRLPFAGKIYLQYGLPPEKSSVTPGEIIEIIQNGFNINTPTDEILNVLITPQTKYPSGSDFNIGDKIIIIGDRDGKIIHAFGIRQISDREYFRPPFPKPPR